MFTCIQAARFIAAALILVEHTREIFGLPRYYSYHSILSGYNWWLGVDFFFVLSGFIIFYAHEKDIGQPARLGRYAINRVCRIYPTYIIIFVVVIVPLYFTQSNFHELIRDPIYVSKALLLLPTANPFIQPSWTLQHEVVFYLIFGVMIASRTLGVVLLGAWFLASSFISNGMLPSADVLTDPRHIEFLGGMAAAMFVRYRSIASPRIILMLGLVGFWSAFAHFNTHDIDDEAVTRAAITNLTVVVALSSAMILCALVELERNHAWRAPAVLRYLGDASYAIYLVHVSTQTIFARLVFAMHIERYIPVAILFILTVIAGLVAGVIFYQFVEIPVQAILKRRLLPLVRQSTAAASQSLG